MQFIIWLQTHWEVVAAALIAFLSGIVAVLVVIPGEQGETTIQKVIDFLKKLLPVKKA